MIIKKIAMVGAGTMGNQIAMQVAISGFDVTCYSRKETTIANAKAYIANIAPFSYNGERVLITYSEQKGFATYAHTL